MIRIDMCVYAVSTKVLFLCLILKGGTTYPNGVLRVP